ncbi:MAG: hypothetical protein HYV96_08655 [Opitutae bacterium]|nr:hypothetical protein [Opitutae bacterium]
MKTRPFTFIALALMLALAAPPTRGAEKTAAELEKELALAKAENAVLKAEADLAKKKAALQQLQGGKPAEPEDKPGEVGEKAVEPKPKKVTAVTEDLRAHLPTSFEWREVKKTGTDLLTHAGTRVIAPYTIDKATKELKTDGTRLGGYLELFYSNTWAWQPDGAASSIAYGVDPTLYGGSQWNDAWNPKQSRCERQLLSDSDAVWVSPIRWFEDPDDTIDYTTRLSLEFANGAKNSASTVTGSGDFSGEVGLDAHILQGYATNTLFTLGLGGSIGASTDREARRVHPRYFAGIVGKFGRVITKDDGKKRLALAHLGLGQAWFDNVQLDPDDPTRSHVLFDGVVPSYRQNKSMALEFELFYPVLDANYAYLGARLYNHTDPGQWSVTVGYSLDLAEFFSSFKSKSNAAEPATANKAPEKNGERSPQ